jgi:hypothetical protein
MSIGTAVSVGMGIIKHRQEIGEALSGLSQLSGAGFAKIAQDFHLPKGLTQSISSALNAHQQPQSPSSAQVLAGMHYFDANQDGNVSQAELSQGLNQLKATGQDGTGKGAQLYKLGDLMLKNYNKVAQLDGAANGISANDTLKLASQDGKGATLSTLDWQKLNA